MTISFDLLDLIERKLDVSSRVGLDREAKVAYLVELYRQGRIHHHQLAEALGLSRLETDGVLKRFEIPSGPVSVAELRTEVGSLREVRVETAPTLK